MNGPTGLFVAALVLVSLVGGPVLIIWIAHRHHAIRDAPTALVLSNEIVQQANEVPQAGNWGYGYDSVSIMGPPIEIRELRLQIKDGRRTYTWSEYTETTRYLDIKAGDTITNPRYRFAPQPQLRQA